MNERKDRERAIGIEKVGNNKTTTKEKGNSNIFVRNVGHYYCLVLVSIVNFSIEK